jgi:hypothetical protein
MFHGASKWFDQNSGTATPYNEDSESLPNTDASCHREAGMSRPYFIRDRGRILGPFTREQLFDMRDLGQLQACHEVSTEK